MHKAISDSEAAWLTTFTVMAALETPTHPLWRQIRRGAQIYLDTIATATPERGIFEEDISRALKARGLNDVHHPYSCMAEIYAGIEASLCQATISGPSAEA